MSSPKSVPRKPTPGLGQADRAAEHFGLIGTLDCHWLGRSGDANGPASHERKTSPTSRPPVHRPAGPPPLVANAVTAGPATPAVAA